MTISFNSNTSYKWGLTRSSSNERDLERVARNNGVSQIRLHCRRNPFQGCQVFAFILSRILVTGVFAMPALLQICLVEKASWIIQSCVGRTWILEHLNCISIKFVNIYLYLIFGGCTTITFTTLHCDGCMYLLGLRDFILSSDGTHKSCIQL